MDDISFGERISQERSKTAQGYTDDMCEMLKLVGLPETIDSIVIAVEMTFDDGQTATGKMRLSRPQHAASAKGGTEE